MRNIKVEIASKKFQKSLMEEETLICVIWIKGSEWCGKKLMGSNTEESGPYLRLVS